jgi:subtilisin family serine protease
MDVLSTSTTRPQPATARGTLQGMTTDVQGAGGYNTGAGTVCLSGSDPTSPPANALDYTYCFDGTSFATPVAAGIAGLVLSLDTTPTRLQVQRLIQDSADKTEDSLAAYDTELGFSNAGAAATPATHGFGRVNAFEAVRIAAPTANNGLGGVDIFVRDNRLDWGNTEQPSNVVFEPVRGFLGHWQSVDIKIDAPPYETPPGECRRFRRIRG